MANSVDPDQLASSEDKWSGSTLLANAGHIRIQQDKGQSANNTSIRRHFDFFFFFFQSKKGLIFHVNY